MNTPGPAFEVRLDTVPAITVRCEALTGAARPAQAHHPAGETGIASIEHHGYPLVVMDIDRIAPRRSVIVAQQGNLVSPGRELSCRPRPSAGPDRLPTLPVSKRVRLPGAASMTLLEWIAIAQLATSIISLALLVKLVRKA